MKHKSIPSLGVFILAAVVFLAETVSLAQGDALAESAYLSDAGGQGIDREGPR
jgi:hypothetical protein